jgi:hypothetical protein
MVQIEIHEERIHKSSPPNLAIPGFAGRKCATEVANVPTELFDEMQQTIRQWFDRMQSEAHFTSELHA